MNGVTCAAPSSRKARVMTAVEEMPSKSKSPKTRICFPERTAFSSASTAAERPGIRYGSSQSRSSEGARNTRASSGVVTPRATSVAAIKRGSPSSCCNTETAAGSAARILNRAGIMRKPHVQKFVSRAFSHNRPRMSCPVKSTWTTGGSPPCKGHAVRLLRRVVMPAVELATSQAHAVCHHHRQR